MSYQKLVSIVKANYFRAKAAEYIWQFIGRPYAWGGDDPMAGFDCSGLIVEVLRATGLLAPHEDLTADGLWQKFKKYQVVKPYTGCLLFWFKNNKAIHVEMAIDDFFTIGASGGGPHVKDLSQAIKENAFVKMNPIESRPGWRAVDPFLTIGESP